jgi:hypothetical protein
MATYDLIVPLECELGKPVLAANQVTMWAALRVAHETAHGDLGLWIWKRVGLTPSRVESRILRRPEKGA